MDGKVKGKGQSEAWDSVTVTGCSLPSPTQPLLGQKGILIPMQVFSVITLSHSHTSPNGGWLTLYLGLVSRLLKLADIMGGV